jgi:hypothetical protein
MAILRATFMAPLLLRRYVISPDTKSDPIWGTLETIGGRPHGGQRGINATAFDVGRSRGPRTYFQTAVREPKMTA